MRKLIDKALALKMDDAQILSIDQLEVDPSLTNYCRDCEAYGLSAHCPPHGLSSNQFSVGLVAYQNVLVVKRDVSVDVLQGDDQLPFARQIHLTVAQLEKQAQLLGFKAAAFSAGSCKRLFCSSSQECQLLQENGICRFPQWARPSVSGVGINVFSLCETLGWPIEKLTKNSEVKDGDMGLLLGLVLLGRKE